MTQDYMVLVQSRPVLETVIDNLRLDMEYETLKGMVSLNNQSDTRILDITVTADDPYMAKEIVDEISEVSVSRIAAIMNVDEPTNSRVRSSGEQSKQSEYQEEYCYRRSFRSRGKCRLYRADVSVK